MESLQQLVKDHIDEYHKKSNGSCGLTIPSISQDLNIDMASLLKILRELYNQNKITTRNGINGKLIFKIEQGKKLSKKLAESVADEQQNAEILRIEKQSQL
jgi:CTP-dependent riboflavin kinase